MSAAMPRHWLFLRGLSRDARHWNGLPERFAQRLQVTVQCIDLPGNGSRVGERSPSTMAGLVEACRERCRAAEPAPPFGFVALSLGAMVAVEWARRHPDEVGACVLMNTSAREGSPWYRRLRPNHYFAMASAFLAGNAEQRERTILQATSRADPDSPEGREILARWTTWDREAPVTRANALRQLLAASRFTPPEQMRAPTLLLASQLDALVDVRCSEALAERWHCELCIHPQAGHDLALDAPEWVVERVAAWHAA
ncbi:alpha/beta hydrolase [Lysobacter sp. KIS68-7]|uniref:alpha/beta fold hydrolase n=1 Tax=Lysobacter sp. KIS68-7 TaxID=2904252 RepID=UPI001E5759B4|nr:alpha/beta hydrolase [Lysobacter sp. KIS68-7]UHQ19551.1 alpha/beta hydrolase [Lysobacter sp. KIS68-7]